MAPPDISEGVYETELWAPLSVLWSALLVSPVFLVPQSRALTSCSALLLVLHSLSHQRSCFLLCPTGPGLCLPAPVLLPPSSLDSSLTFRSQSQTCILCCSQPPSVPVESVLADTPPASCCCCVVLALVTGPWLA